MTRVARKRSARTPARSSDAFLQDDRRAPLPVPVYNYAAMTAGAGRRRKPARETRELSAESIRTAALRLIDRDGLDGFSIRKLGMELHCEGMAIYWYFASKDALLDGVVELLMASVASEIEGEPADWVAALRSLATAYRRIAHDHPKAFPLLATRRFATEGTYAFLERLFELARRHGIDDRTTARFYRVVASYCNGFALNELAAPRGQQDPAGPLRRKFTRVAAVSEWLEPRYLDDVFNFGLELQLDALTRSTQGATAR
jgi:AcrR family transcriptional regulator